MLLYYYTVTDLLSPQNVPIAAGWGLVPADWCGLYRNYGGSKPPPYKVTASESERNRGLSSFSHSYT